MLRITVVNAGEDLRNHLMLMLIKLSLMPGEDLRSHLMETIGCSKLLLMLERTYETVGC